MEDVAGAGDEGWEAEAVAGADGDGAFAGAVDADLIDFGEGFFAVGFRDAWAFDIFDHRAHIDVFAVDYEHAFAFVFFGEYDDIARDIGFDIGEQQAAGGGDLGGVDVKYRVAVFNGAEIDEEGFGFDHAAHGNAGTGVGVIITALFLELEMQECAGGNVDIGGPVDD